MDRRRLRFRQVNRFLLLLLAVVPLAACAEATSGGPGGSPIPSRQPQGRSFADVVERVGPAVVRIVTVERGLVQAPTAAPAGRGTSRDGSGRPNALRPPPAGQRWIRLGSGFIVDARGYVVTNSHLLDEAAEVHVQLADGSMMNASIVLRDAPTDVALIMVQSEDALHLPTVDFGDSDHQRVGEWVMAMGHPFGLGGTATAGIISARGRQIGPGFEDFIQTDAAINPGSSGGPLFNRAGEVIGMTTAIFSPSGGNVGIGFAVVSNVVRPMVASLLPARSAGAPRDLPAWIGRDVARVSASP